MAPRVNFLALGRKCYETARLIHALAEPVFPRRLPLSIESKSAKKMQLFPENSLKNKNWITIHNEPKLSRLMKADQLSIRSGGLQPKSSIVFELSIKSNQLSCLEDLSKQTTPTLSRSGPLSTVVWVTMRRRFSSCSWIKKIVSTKRNRKRKNENEKEKIFSFCLEERIFLFSTYLSRILLGREWRQLKMSKLPSLKLQWMHLNYNLRLFLNASS